VNTQAFPSSEDLGVSLRIFARRLAAAGNLNSEMGFWEHGERQVVEVYVTSIGEQSGW